MARQKLCRQLAEACGWEQRALLLSPYPHLPIRRSSNPDTCSLSLLRPPTITYSAWDGSDSPGTRSPDCWSVQVTRPLYGITWVLHISSWNSSRNPLLAVLWLSLLVYLSPLQPSSCSALWAWRDGLCQTHTLSQSWCDHPASASISSLPPTHHVLVNTRYLSGSHSSGSFSPLDTGWPLSAWLWLAK